MKLLHGSNIIVTSPNLKECHDGNDFGKGFYLTDNQRRAFLMARRRVLLRGGMISVSPFKFSIKSAVEAGLNVKRFPGFTVEWARFVLQNRRGEAPGNTFDIIIGPVADSTIDNEIDKYIDEFGPSYLQDSNLEILISRISQFGIEYVQYCFRTERSLKQLSSISK